MKILSCSPNGSFIERGFSLQGITHTKLRNRLAIEKAKKLMFSRCNTTLSNTNGRINMSSFYDSLDYSIIQVYRHMREDGHYQDEDNNPEEPPDEMQLDEILDLS